MKESTAWRRIAEEIDEGSETFICPSIRRGPRAMVKRLRLFKPEPDTFVYWNTGPEGRNCRVLTCLFLAAMTK